MRMCVRVYVMVCVRMCVRSSGDAGLVPPALHINTDWLRGCVCVVCGVWCVGTCNV